MCIYIKLRNSKGFRIFDQLFAKNHLLCDPQSSAVLIFPEAILDLPLRSNHPSSVRHDRGCMIEGDVVGVDTCHSNMSDPMVWPMGKHPPTAGCLCQNDSIKKKKTSKLFSLQSKKKCSNAIFWVSNFFLHSNTFFLWLKMFFLIEATFFWLNNKDTNVPS